MKKQVSFADATAQNHLDGVTATSIILRDTHDFLVGRDASGAFIFMQRQVEQVDGIQGSLISDGQSAAGMTVKLNTFIP